VKRTVVVELWSGAHVVRRLDHADQAPKVDELNAVAAAWTASNGGVRPVVRVLEQSSIPHGRGVPGSVPA
jgi:hypothetical protein